MCERLSLNLKLRISFGIISNVISVNSLIREITETSKESAKEIQEITKNMHLFNT